MHGEADPEPRTCHSQGHPYENMGVYECVGVLVVYVESTLLHKARTG